ncbi:MAG: glycosyltransferase family 2 protein [Thermomicrobiales bacterium]
MSVIIPTFRRVELLERSLDAVVAQRFPADEFEVIVADDAADPTVKAVVSKVARNSRQHGGPTVVYLPVVASQGPAAARNAAEHVAKGAILAFTDDDTIAHPEWLSAGIAAIEDGADAVSGCIHVPVSSTPPVDYERDAARLSQAEFATANCFVRRDVFRAVGRFDERFTHAWREDSDLHFRLLDHGFSIVRAPESIVIHPVRPAPHWISLMQQRKSEFNALLFKKHRGRYRQQIQKYPPFGYYLSILGLLGMVLRVGRGGRWGAFSAVLWILSTLRFAWLRLRETSRSPAHVASMVVTSALIPPISVFWRLRGAVRHRVFFL